MDYQDYLAGKGQENFWFQGKRDLIIILLAMAGHHCTDHDQTKILDIGAGTGSDLHVLSQYGHTYLIDKNPSVFNHIDDVHCAEKRVADACDLPYHDNFFDIAVSFDVFEHIKHDHQAAAEIFRTLKPGGSLLYTVPAFPSLYGSHDRALDHVRRYDMNTVATLLSDFEGLQRFYWNSTLFLPGAAMRFLRKNTPAKVDKGGSPFLTHILFQILRTENRLIYRGVHFPFGLSIVGYTKKRV